MTAHFATTDVAIIGGGLAGLTAASYLARAGIDVTLFEKSASLGGRATTQNYDGYFFNRGVHALYTGGAISEVLKDLGITYDYGIPKDVFVLQNGKLSRFPQDLPSLMSTDLLDLRDKLEFGRMLATLSRVDASKFAHMSVQEWIEQTFRRPQVRRFMTGFANPYTYTVAHDLVSAEVVIDKLQRNLKHPVHYITGGWITLVDGLRKVAEQAGAHIVSGERVETVEIEDGRVRGVRLPDGGMVRAAAVIIATTPQEAVKLVDSRYPMLRQIVDPLITVRVACLDVALSHMPDPRHPIVQDLDQPRFMTTQSVYASIAPQGGALIHTFKQLDPRQPGDPHEDERDLEALLDTVQPGWRDALVKRVYLPRIEAVSMLPTASGGGYAGRPGPRVPRIDNLFLAGDWIGPGFLADASMGSARQVAHLLLQDSLFTATNRVGVGR